MAAFKYHRQKMSCASTVITSSPAMLKRTRCRSPAANSKLSNSLTPGTRCLVYLRRCLAIQLQKVGMFPNNTTASGAATTNFENSMERDAPLYWMYDSGYLIFQGFLDANLKCFWNGALIEAMKVLEFQGYIAPGVLLVSGSPCALEVVRAAWARNVLKPPSNYAISIVGDVDDCLVEPISQGQFTPLTEALCWIILDLTASGQPAVMESICSTLQVAFPDMQKPSEQMVYDTLATLMAEKKLYQTSNGYFVMTPDKMRLSGLISGKTEYTETFIGGHQKQILLTPEEAAVVMHGEIETVRDGNVTHQAIQTNLADVICGGNANDKVLYPRVSTKIRSGYSSERLERRHSLRFFGHGRRSVSLQRTGSVRHIADKTERAQTAKELTSPDDVTRKQHTSLLSRLFRRSGRVRRDGSPSPVGRPTFSAQFPPAEWFNRGVTHLHSVGTQTSYLAPSTDTLPKRSFDYDLDDMSLQDMQQRRHISAFGTPRMARRTSHSVTLPRRSLKKSQMYGNSAMEKDSASRMSSQNSVLAAPSNDTCVTPRTSSHSSISSSKTVISKDHLKRSSPTHKSMSSASSGYNSLPRSVCNSVRTSKTSSSRSSSSARNKSKSKERTTPESSITFHVSAKSSSGYEDEGNSSKTETSATTMTTTINSGNKTKIFLQQHNTPTRSLITFENSTDKNKKPEVVIMNQPYSSNKDETKENKKPSRPTSLYGDQNNLVKSNKQSAKILETQLKSKFPSTEMIELEEKSVEDVENSKLCKNDWAAKNKNLFVSGSENELNNTKNYLINQNSNVDKINNLRNKNLLNHSNKEDVKFINSEPTSPIIEHNSNKFVDLKNYNESKIEKDLEGLNLDDSQLRKNPDFPSLSDLSMRFTSLAAQSILKGVSYNSVDTLVEVNMAAEKKRNCEMSISTDLGVV